MITVGEIFKQYRDELILCSQGKGQCDTVIDIVKERIIDVERIVPPDMWFWIIISMGVFFVLFLLSGIRIVRPMDRYLVETLGKFKKTFDPGFHWIIPIIQRTVKVNITEQMVDIESQVIITKDNLNARVDGVVYYRVVDPKAAIYEVDNHEVQLASLARTTLRAVIGKMQLNEANENRNKINSDIELILDKETKSYGVDVLRVELQSVDPPQDVQESMNEMVKAEREKQAEKDRALQIEIRADGAAKGAIKEAEGNRQAAILEADGKAKAFEMIDKAFVGNAQLLKQLEVTQASLQKNSKIIIAEKGTNLQMLIGKLPTE